MPRSGLAQSEDVGQRGTLDPPRRDGSLTSSSRSVQSLASYDFSKLDRLDDSLNTPGIVRSAASNSSQQDVRTLPDEKGFSIQIGSELFRLSGASIMSDAPSYFSAYFIEQLQQSEDRTAPVRTLFIDRDPITFRAIARHLQGYLISPTDGHDFVKLFADAQFYRLPRLQSQLFESEIFVEVGNEHFRVPRDIFSAPGDTPNFFTLGFTVFFTSPGDVFPGLNPRGLLRPPGIHPPRVPNRSPQIFSDILHMLRGYPLTIKDEDHRNQLLKDARYYNLRGLEQKLIPHEITFNLEQRVTEIVIRLQDLKPSQISAVYERQPLPDEDHFLPRKRRYVHYARPFISEPHHALILEICASKATEPILLDHTTKRITVFGNTRSRITALFQTIANKLNLPTTVPLGLMMAEGANPESRGKGPGSTGLSEEKIMADISTEACVKVDGEEWVDEDIELFGEKDTPAVEVEDFADTLLDWPRTPLQIDEIASTKRPLGSPSDDRLTKRRRAGDNQAERHIWTVDKSQWRLRLQSTSIAENDGPEEERRVEIVMVAVKIEATSGEKARNIRRRFLS
ncbi:MAG: hypothetical protein L6R36_006693 [Xanthoria steineri]|nr:MAG: hypothetical protein L6R36_006693 [Xanthoria steineri]